MTATSRAQRSHRPGLVLAGVLYAASFVLPVAWSPDGTPAAWGWQCFLVTMLLPLQQPIVLLSPWGLLWVVNPLCWTAMRLALKGRWWGARGAGVTAFACALAPFYAFGGDGFTDIRCSAGYICWAASVGVLAVVTVVAASPIPLVMPPPGAERPTGQPPAPSPDGDGPTNSGGL